MSTVPDDLLVGLRRARDRIDRHYAEPLDLDALAATAGLSKYHFLRCFARTYGRTPHAYLTERRVERAQDLLRATNLTVTEVCWLVGYSGLGSFSTRFRRLVGCSPSEYQARWAMTGPPRIPGCFVMMHGLGPSNSGEGSGAGHARRILRMITNISLLTLYVTDQDEARKFYCDVMGFTDGTDVMLGEGFRWVTIKHPEQPELEVTLMVPGPPLNDEMAGAVRRALASGSMGGFGLTTDDCRAEYERLTKLGVEFTQEPSERPYGVEAVMRDNSGNWLVLVEPRAFSPEDFG